MKILLIEDHLELAAQLNDFLCGLGWTVDFSATGTQGIWLALENEYDLIILDLGLPDIDGIDVCKEIKQKSNVNIPILMLTARDSFADKVKGFDYGADEYLTKPYDLRELALRCKVLTRRQELYQSNTMSLEDLSLDLNENKVFRFGQEVVLNKTAFSILLLLVKAYPNPVSKSRITHEIWGDEPPETNSLKSHIYNLRAAVDKPFATNIIKTIVNVGYKLDIEQL
jgi:DNA-binding response OmpR family regulator